MMAESGGARKWVIAGAVLQIFTGGFQAILGIIFMLDVGITRNLDPNDPSLPLMVGITTYLLLGSFIGLILLILWFLFAINSNRFRKAILVTGVIGLVLCGIVPGILVILGGTKVKEHAEVEYEMKSMSNDSS